MSQLEPTPQKPQENLNELTVGKVRILHIDMNPMLIPEIAENENEQLIKGLKKFNLYDPKYAYSIVSPDQCQQLLATGTYRFSKNGEPKGSIFCLSPGYDEYEEETLIDDMGSNAWNDYINFPNSSSGIPLAVYDRNLMERIDGGLPSEYRFVCEDRIEALIAVVILDSY